MVCPLRFVLLGASAVVALCGVVFVTHNKAKRSNRQGRLKVRKQVLLTSKACKEQILHSLRLQAFFAGIAYWGILQLAPEGQITSVQDDTVWWRTVVDMLTGRYLWQAYRDWREGDVETRLTR